MRNEIDTKNNFYLGFNKSTGELVQVIAPDGKELRLDPRDFHLFSLGILEKREESEEHEQSGKRINREIFLDQLESFNKQIKRNALPSTTLTLLDRECGSVCGGSCGGIPFRFC